jgi:hypothetical protein
MNMDDILFLGAKIRSRIEVLVNNKTNEEKTSCNISSTNNSENSSRNEFYEDKIKEYSKSVKYLEIECKGLAKDNGNSCSMYIIY